MIEATSTNALVPTTLNSLVTAAYLADPSDMLISPIGEHSYSTLFGLIPATLAVLRVAAAVEPDPSALLTWYLHTPIAELGHLNAAQLIELGRAEAVISFLRSVLEGDRD